MTEEFTPVPDETLLGILEIEAKATPGEWSTPHLSEPDVNCQCRYILCEGYAGSVATVEVGDGKSISDGGNDCPPLGEAMANGSLIAHSRNSIRAIVLEVLSSREREGEMLERCARVALAERVSGETGSPEDEAYNRACEDICAAIRGLAAYAAIKGTK